MSPQSSSKFEPSPAILASGSSTYAGLFASIVNRCAAKIASVDGARQLTYKQLDERSNQLAKVLIDQGLVRGDRVGVLLRNCQEYLEIELAAAKTGIIVAALNWRLGPRELSHCINLVTPKLLITDQAFAADHDLSDHPTLLVGTAYENQISEHSTTPLPLTVEPEDGLIILYTSGTTGMPKGALVSQRAMVARAMAFASELHLPDSANFVAWAPFYHMASTDQSLATLLRGGTVFIVDGYQPKELMDIVEQHTIGWFVLMPGMVGEIATACKQRGVKPKGIVTCGAMADLVPRDQIAAVTTALNTPYLNSFGATETGLPPATGALIPIGEAPKTLPKRQSAFCEIRLVDADDDDVADGEPGEIAIRGPTLFSGYWNAEETNAHDFRGGWFHMGDVMRRNTDGTLDYVDRAKYLIKSGGENIYPAEIEKVVLEDERIEEAIAVRQADKKWGEVPVLYVVRNGGGQEPIDQAAILSICEENLSGYKRPASIIFVEEHELPRSTTGKVQRHELEKRLLGQTP